MSTREVGYWWVSRPDGSEMVYWTGSEAQLFGTDATLREHEISEWIRFEGSTPKPKDSAWADYPKVMAARRRIAGVASKPDGVVIDPNLLPIGTTSVLLGESIEVRLPGEPRNATFTLGVPAATTMERLVRECTPDPMPPGYDLVEDHEDPGTFQAWRRPWGGTWTMDKEQAAKDAWANLRSIAAPLLRGATAAGHDYPTDWGHGQLCMCEPCCEASENEAASPAPDDDVLELLGVDHLDPLSAARLLGKRLIEALGKRGAPSVTVTTAPYDPARGETVTVHTEQWRPGKGQTR